MANQVDPAAVAAELVGMGPTQLIDVLSELDLALQDKGTSLADIASEIEAAGQEDDGEADYEDDGAEYEEEVPMHQGDSVNVMAMEAPMPQGRQRISMR